MVRRRRQEVHVNQERWLISYADFITLLFAFFVVMYSISQVNDSKYRVLSDTFIEAFHQTAEVKTDSDSQPNTSPSNDVINPLDMVKMPGEPADRDEQKPKISDHAIDAPQVDPQTPDLPVKTSDELGQISDLVSEKFTQLINDQMIQVSSNELWLQIELKDSILFSSGSA